MGESPSLPSLALNLGDEDCIDDVHPLKDLNEDDGVADLGHKDCTAVLLLPPCFPTRDLSSTG